MSGILVLILRIALLASLYGFLGWAMYTIWRELRAQGSLISSPQIPVLTLALSGDANPADRKVFEVPEIILGRSSTNEYPIQDNTVSSRHARLSFHHNQWWLEDLHSTNGTFLNDERVSVPTVIVAGDELRIGSINLLIGIGEKNGKE